MANTYKLWLSCKEKLNHTLLEDSHLQSLATRRIGLKPQSTAVDVVARVYCKYCDLYNSLCDCYDQMQQVQRRVYIKKIIDTLTCRILELKKQLEKIEAFEYTYPDNALQSLLMVPEDIQIVCPFFYPFEIRSQEMQYIIDEIFAGNRLGDPQPTPSEIALKEETRLEEERLKQEEKEAEERRRHTLGIFMQPSIESIVYTPEQLAEIKQREEYASHLSNIQRMERSRSTTRAISLHKNFNENMYLEMSGNKAPPPRDRIRERACSIIQKVCRRYMEIKREKFRDNQLRERLGMIVPSITPASQKIQLEKVKEIRRNYRRAYHKKWLEENIKENSRVFRLREKDIMEDITTEVRAWFQEWYDEVRCFDEYPYPGEAGSVLVVRGQTMTTEEFIEWRKLEEKRLKAEEGTSKTKEQIKSEKKEAREEIKRLAQEVKDKEKKTMSIYKKQRLSYKNDPGHWLTEAKQFTPLEEAWGIYENQWKNIDTPDPELQVIKGYIKELITENVYQDINLQLRPIVDEMMKIELKLLRKALKKDRHDQGIEAPPIVKKRKRPARQTVPKPEKLVPEVIFQRLVDEGVIVKYPPTSLNDFWGDRNYAACEMRAIPWTPAFPLPCLGDVREQVRVRCLLALGSGCTNAERSHLLVGPKSSGKLNLIYAIATETNSILIDLSPMNIYNKFPGTKRLKKMLLYVNKVSRMMQPTVILIRYADKMFYKKVPKEEKAFDPKRLSKQLHKQVIKGLTARDRVLVLGTAEEPWLAKSRQLSKAFPSTILLPPTDYGSVSLALTTVLMKYPGVDRDFDVHSLAQVLKGYDIRSIIQSVKNILTAERIVQLKFRPLESTELLNYILEQEDAKWISPEDYEKYKEWYQSYSPWGPAFVEYMIMLQKQLDGKLKEEKKDNKKKKK